jgi:putative ABC transport system permease protein
VLNRRLEKQASWFAVIGTVPGRAGDATIARLERRFAPYLTELFVPTDLVNFGQAISFPALLGLTLALFGVATLAHLLLVSVSRRRKEVALLKVLGFLRRQVSAAVCWQATTVCLIGIVVGVPVGIIIGRSTWRLFATAVGVEPVAVVPAPQVVLVAVGVIVVGNAIAILPATLAARLRPAEALRAT